MGVQFGGGSKTKPQTTTMTRNVAPQSANESMLEMLNTRIAQSQGDQLQRAMGAQQQYESSPLFGQLQGLQGQAATGLQGIMGGQQLINPAQQQALQQYYQSIMNPAMEQMQRAGSQEAARRGMTLSDSPVGNEFARQMAAYQAQMGGQQAGSALQLSGQNQNMYQNVLNFGQQMKQNADQNRLALSTARPGSYDLGNSMAQNRIGAAGTTQTTSGGGTSQSPQWQLGLGNALGAAQQGLNLWSGTYKGSTPGLQSEFFQKKTTPSASTGQSPWGY